MVTNFVINTLARLRSSLGSLFAGNEAEDLAYGDPEGILVDGETRRQREQRLSLADHHHRARAVEATKRKEKDDFDLLVTLLMVQEQQRILSQIRADIADARKAVTLAYNQALFSEAAALARLANAQRSAIVLPDGRRVYFTRDGSALYGEDFQRITDETTIRTARHSQRPSSTTYEDFWSHWHEWHGSAERVRQLEEALGALDDIEKRIETGSITTEELLKARADTDKIIEGLPSKIHAEYGRIRAARSPGQEPAFRAANVSFSSLPTVSADFFNAVNSTAKGLQSNSLDKPDNRLPAYRSAPDF